LGSQHGSIPQNDDHPAKGGGGGGSNSGGGAASSAQVGYHLRQKGLQGTNDDRKRAKKESETNKHRQSGKGNSKNSASGTANGPDVTAPLMTNGTQVLLGPGGGATVVGAPVSSPVSQAPVGSAPTSGATTAGNPPAAGAGAPARVKSKSTLFVVSSTVPNALYTADGRTHWILGCAPSGAPNMVDPVDYAIDVKDFGHGWYVVSDDSTLNTKRYRPEPATHRQVVPGYRREDKNGLVISYPSETYLVYEPFVSKLGHFLNAPDVDEALAQAVSALRTKYTVPAVCQDLMVQTAQYHIAQLHIGYGKFNNARAARRIRGSEGVDMLSRENATAYAQLGVTTDRHEVWYDMAHGCLLAMNYPLRTDIRVTKSIGVEDVNGNQIDAGDLTEIPYFTSKERLVFRDEKYFEFMAPDLTPFISYNFSNRNYTCALKRLLGSRGAPEEVLRSNALHMGKLFAEELRTCRMTCVSIGNTCTETLDLSFGNDISDMERDLRNKRRTIPIDNTVAACQAFVAQEAVRIVQCCNRTRIQKFIDGLCTGVRWAYLIIVLGFMQAFRALMSRQACANIPHIKQKLRQRYVKNNLFATTQLMVGPNDVASVQLKREIGKSGKPPRTTVAYDAGCMYANELPEFVKVCIDGMHVYQCGEYTLLVFVMAKPKSDSLEKVFADLDNYWMERHTIYIALYSDDGVTSGLGQALNVDIKSCDAGQDVPAFLALYAGMRRFHREHSAGLIKQAMLPLLLQPGGRRIDGRESALTIQFDGPILGSGLVTTTPLNHMIMQMIAIAALYYVAHGEQSLAEAYHKGAAAMGHLVTTDEVEIMEDFQFLKRSCTIVKERVSLCGGRVEERKRYIPFINTACLLRNLGKVEDGMTHKHLGILATTYRALTDDQRADRFFGAVIAGWKNEANNDVLRALRSRFQPEAAGLEVEPDSLKFVFEEAYDYRSFDVSHGIRRRYRLDQVEVEELVQGILSVQLGQTRSIPALRKIYSKDYGVGLVDWDHSDPQPIMHPEAEVWRPWQM